MKWKDQRRSKNVIDKTNETLSDKDWDELEKTGYFNSPEKPVRPNSKIAKAQKDFEVAKKLQKMDKEGTTPIPTPKPTRIQVTPGKWKTTSK